MPSKTVVIYKSKYGSAKRYAEWIAEETKGDLFDGSEIKAEDMLKYDTIVYGGSLYAVGILGISLIKKNFDKRKESNYIFCRCIALQIRHELNEYLLSYGGHISYGIRPSERRHGFASLMLSLSLPKAKELGINRALVTCDKENTASAKTIKSNGGVLGNEIKQQGEITQRYLIEI